MNLSRTMIRLFTLNLLCGLLLLSIAKAEEAVEGTAEASAAWQTVKYQVTGLFSPDRAQDLREVVSGMEGVSLVSVDYRNAEAIFVYDPLQLFPNAKPSKDAKTPEEVLAQFHDRLGLASRRTLGVKPVCEVPREKLEWVEIPVAGLDCKGCSYAAYLAIFEMEGVEQATASFQQGLVTAWIHPEKTNQAALEEALEKKNVTLAKEEE